MSEIAKLEIIDRWDTSALHKAIHEIADRTLAIPFTFKCEASFNEDEPYTKLSTIPLEGWTVEKMDECLFYWQPHGDQNGFEFAAYDIIGDDPEGTLVQKTFHGTAYFDGVRHLHFGCVENDNDGYDYYPNIDTHIRVLQRVKELENELCPSR